MPGLDTNVLVRWLVDDDASQVARIRTVFESAQRGSETLFVSCTVMLELEWVLRSRYQFDKPAILGAINALLETQELEFQSESAIEWALHLFRQFPVGAGNLLITVRAQHAKSVRTCI